MSPRRCAIALVALASLLLTACMTGEEQGAFDRVNGERSGRGIWTLGEHETLVQKGQGWARALLNNSGGLCNSNTLKHSNLASGAPLNWHSLGENVGCAVTLHQSDAVGIMHAQFMQSPGHAGNILSRTFNYGGIGTASAQLPNGAWLTFEVQEFAAL